MRAPEADTGSVRLRCSQHLRLSVNHGGEGDDRLGHASGIRHLPPQRDERAFAQALGLGPELLPCLAALPAILWQLVKGDLQ